MKGPKRSSHPLDPRAGTPGRHTSCRAGSRGWGLLAPRSLCFAGKGWAGFVLAERHRAAGHDQEQSPAGAVFVSQPAQRGTASALRHGRPGSEPPRPCGAGWPLAPCPPGSTQGRPTARCRGRGHFLGGAAWLWPCASPGPQPSLQCPEHTAGIELETKQNQLGSRKLGAVVSHRAYSRVTAKIGRLLPC